MSRDGCMQRKGVLQNPMDKSAAGIATMISIPRRKIKLLPRSKSWYLFVQTRPSVSGQT